MGSLSLPIKMALAGRPVGISSKAEGGVFGANTPISLPPSLPLLFFIAAPFSA